MLSVDGEMSLTEIGASLQDRNAKEVNAGEDGNEEKCWGSWPAGNYFVWEVGGNVYCIKLYDKRILLKILDIGNRWRERVLEG